MRPIEHKTQISIEDTEAVASAVASAIAGIQGIEPTDIEPIYKMVDTDAFDALFSNSTGLQAVEFNCYNYDCRLEQTGQLIVTEWRETDDEESSLSDDVS